MRAFGAVRDASRLRDLATQDEVGEVKSHERPSCLTKVAYAKGSWRAIFLTAIFRVRRSERPRRFLQLRAAAAAFVPPLRTLRQGVTLVRKRVVSGRAGPCMRTAMAA